MTRSSVVSLVVSGDPAPQGSKTAVVRGGRAVVIEGSSGVGRRKHRAWRNAVQAAAMPHRRPADDAKRPVTVRVDFVMPWPKSLPQYRRGTVHERKPDLDKLVRSTLDGLEDGGLLPGGDSRVTSLHASKRYAADGEPSGAYVVVTFLPQPRFRS